MIRKTFLCFSLITLCLSAWAKPINPQKAKQIAKEHFARIEKRASDDDNSTLKLVHSFKGNDALLNEGNWSKNDLGSDSNQTYFYAFNRGEGDGFVLVAADDRAPLVLAYSLSGSFKTDKMPSNLQAWLHSYRSQIALLIDGEANPFDASELNLRELPLSVNALLESGEHSSDPILWDQGYPWNALIPKLPSGATPPVGCVATAIAQIMKYYNWPESSEGSYSYVDSLYKDPPQTFEGNFGATYNWAKMPGSIPFTEDNELTEALGTFNRDVSLAVQMQYGAAGSGTWSQYALRALRENFHYRHSASLHERQFYSKQEWHQMIRKELAESRPVYYAGGDTGTGHAFVCDGYDANGYYHFNWGWEGSANGMFMLSLLNPGAQGIGAGSGGYTLLQEIVIGIIPAKTAAEIGEKALPTLYIKKFRDVAVDPSNGIYINASVGNISDITADFEIGYSISSNGAAATYSDVVHSATISWKTGYWNQHYFDFTIPADALKTGHNKISLVYRRKGDLEWKRDLYHEQNGNMPSIELNKNADGSIVGIEYGHEELNVAAKQVNSTDINLRPYQQSFIKLDVNNKGKEEVRGRMQIGLKDVSDGFVYDLAWTFVELETNQTEFKKIEFNINALSAGAGNYRIVYRMMDHSANRDWHEFSDFDFETQLVEPSNYPSQCVVSSHEQVGVLNIDRTAAPASLPTFTLVNKGGNYQGQIITKLRNLDNGKSIELERVSVTLANGQSKVISPSLQDYYQDYNSMPNGSYEIMVIASDNYENQALFGRKYYNVKISSSTATEQINADDTGLRVFPTQSSTSVTAQLEEGTSLLVLYTMQGQQIKRIACEGLSQIEIDLSTLAQGSYFIVPQQGSKICKAVRVIKL